MCASVWDGGRERVRVCIYKCRRVNQRSKERVVKRKSREMVWRKDRKRGGDELYQIVEE